jgi:hypothetical protein
MTLECECHVPSPKNAEPSGLVHSINEQFDLDSPAELLVLADTLTLTFTGPDYHFAGLDAYTNKQLWKISQEKVVPGINGRGLLLIEPFRTEGDRVSLDATPRYEIEENQQWIRVVFAEVEISYHYKVANNLVVGLEDGALTDIYLLNVTLM